MLVGIELKIKPTRSSKIMFVFVGFTSCVGKVFRTSRVFLQNVLEAYTNVLFQFLQQEQFIYIYMHIFTGKTGVVVSRTKVMVTVSSIAVNKKSTSVESLV